MNRLTATVLGTAMALMLGRAQASDMQIQLPSNATARSTATLTGPVSQPLLLDIPLSVAADTTDQGYIVRLHGSAAGQIGLTANLDALIQSRYDYHLTLDAVSASQTTLRLLDMNGGIAISGSHGLELPPPISIDALIPQGFDARQLTLSLSISPSFKVIGIGGDLFAAMAPHMLLPDSHGVATITSLSIQAVPEARTWMLMSIGLAGVAGALRIRRAGGTSA